VNGAGVKIDARVEPDDPKNRDRAFPTYQSDDRSLAAWGEKPAAPEPEEETESGSGDKPHPVRPNVLFVVAAKPLPPGKDWKLVIDAAMPASQWKTTLGTRKEIEIGVVKPFAIASIAA